MESAANMTNKTDNMTNMPNITPANMPNMTRLFGGCAICCILIPKS